MIFTSQFRLIRFVLLPIFAIVYASVGYIICLTDEYGRQIFTDKPLIIVIDIAVSTVYTVFCSELSLWLFIRLQRWFPIETRPRMLIVIHIFLIAFLWTEMFTVSQLLIHGDDTKEKIFILKQNILFALVVAIAMNAIQIGMALFQRWKAGIEEAEDLKRANIEAQNLALKQQIDPHFLFNSLNTLTALIEEEPQYATQFVKELSNVYRYVLQSKDHITVSVAEEISFAKAYSYLLELRFGQNFHVDFSISEYAQTRALPPLVVQLCLENAIKHNIVSREKPLFLSITDTDGMLVITNTLQRKKYALASTNIGLNTIRYRYSLLTETAIKIQETDTEFSIELPLLPLCN
jgi:two-component system, LytTR family, sensor kinase